MKVLIQISRCLATPVLPPFSGERSILPIALISAFLATLVSSWPQDLEYLWRNLTPLSSTQREYRLQELERWKLPRLITLLLSLRKRVLAYCTLGPLSIYFISTYMGQLVGLYIL